jgi:hypothetical protein
MSRLRKTDITSTIRGVLVGLSVLALLFIGTTSISVTHSSAYNKTNQFGHPAFISINFSDDSGSMEKNEPIGTDKLMYLSIPAVIGGTNLDSNRPDLKVLGFKNLRTVQLNRRPAFSTTTSISPEKALEFTLVGAKPSGTS